MCLIMADIDIGQPQQINEHCFYENAEKYWSTVDATLNGVLGGYGWISDIDIKGSLKFLNSILKGNDAPGKDRALDCGAGIGRVTSNLLSHLFETVDLVEQNSVFLEEASRTLKDNKKLGVLYPCSLRTFIPTSNYDVIWCQWVLGHLTDEDLVSFFSRCRAALKPNGYIIVKENISQDGPIEDEVDSSVTRTASQFLEIFRDAGLKVLKQAQQSNFPAGLFAVKIFALRPIKTAVNLKQQ